MAVAVLGGTEVGVREIGSTVSIPSNPTARLMYYLDCICSVLDMGTETNLSKLRNFSCYFMLTEPEIDALVSLCFLLSPDELSGKVIIQNDNLCGNSNNEFLELNAVQNNMILAEGILIAGQRRTVRKIMAFKMIWLQTNWVEPMKHFAQRLARIATGQPAVQRQQAIEYRPIRANPPAQTRPAYSNPTPAYRRPISPVYARASRSSSCCTIL